MPDVVRSVTSMLSYEERALLFEIVRRSGGSGAIIDAGCFVGGSTVAARIRTPRPNGRESRSDSHLRFSAGRA